MANLQAIKSRIKSIKNTKQITHAMQLVSASKMKKAQEAALHTTPYSEGLHGVVADLPVIEEFKSPYLREIEDVEKIAVVVIGQTRGFVGGQTTNLMVNTSKEIEVLKKEFPGAKFFGISVNKLGLKIVNTLGIKSVYHFSEGFEEPTTTEMSPVSQAILQGFKKEEFDLVYLSYMKFVNTMEQNPFFKRILPISFDREDDKSANGEEFTFEPDAEEVFTFLLPEYFESQLLNAILNSNASEHSARMVAMKAATDNATQLVDDLTLDYNKSRQAGITQEILEVAMGTAE